MDVAFQFEMVRDHLKPCIGRQLKAEAAEHRPAVAVLNLALRAIDADAIAVPVDKGAAPFERPADRCVERARAPATSAAALPPSASPSKP